MNKGRLLDADEGNSERRSQKSTIDDSDESSIYMNLRFINVTEAAILDE